MAPFWAANGANPSMNHQFNSIAHTHIKLVTVYDLSQLQHNL